MFQHENKRAIPEIKISAMHPGQLEIFNNLRQFNVICCGRRFGKTELLKRMTIRNIAKGKKIGWFSATHKIMLPVYRSMTQLLHPIIETRNQQQKIIYFKNGAELEFWSMDNNEDVGRSRPYHEVIIDEAGLIKGLMQTFESAIMLCLADYDGGATFAGTPKGMNGFHDAFLLGKSKYEPDWASFTASTYANPYLKPSVIDRLKRGMSEDYQQQEIWAKFLDDSGSVFRNVSLVSTEEPLKVGIDGHSYIMGVDPGRVNDFFVITLLDKIEKAQVFKDRHTGMETKACIQRIKEVCLLFHPEIIHIETNQTRTIYEQLRDEGYPVVECFTINANKHQMVDALKYALETQQLKLLNDNNQISELMSYEVTKTPSGNMVFGAPAGKHDDDISALMMAYYFVKQQDFSALDRLYGGEHRFLTDEEKADKAWKDLCNDCGVGDNDDFLS